CTACTTGFTAWGSTCLRSVGVPASMRGCMSQRMPRMARAGTRAIGWAGLSVSMERPMPRTIEQAGWPPRSPAGAQGKFDEYADMTLGDTQNMDLLDVLPSQADGADDVWRHRQYPLDSALAGALAGAMRRWPLGPAQLLSAALALVESRLTGVDVV